MAGPKHNPAIFDGSDIKLNAEEYLVARRELDGIFVTNQRLIVGVNEWPIASLRQVRTELWLTQINRPLLSEERKMKQAQTLLMLWLLLATNFVAATVLFISALLDKLFDVKPRYGYRLIAWQGLNRIILAQDYRGQEMRRLRRAILFVQARERSAN